MPLAPGSRLGDYTISRALGAGGMGEVWLAAEPRLARKVALKILPVDLTRDPTRVQRFEQEARAASALNHPNVCTIHALGETPDGQHYIAMEYVEGETLRHRLSTSRLTIKESLDITTQITAALSAAHAAGIIHRDIKPENVIIRPDGFVKVLDFGLAKLAPAGPEFAGADTSTVLKTEAGVVVGTAAYMSPEQARGQEVDARTDIWSLGVMLYEMVAGRSPFAGPSGTDVLAAIVDREPAPLARFEPDTPSELQRIVTKALGKDRGRRYQTVQDLLLDLQALGPRLEFERTHPTKFASGDDTRLEVFNLPHMRFRIIGVVVCALLLVGVAAGYAWWRQARVPVAPAIKSLAILPLKPLDAEDNDLGLGIADAAIRRVSQTGGLIVRPTSAVRRYLLEDTDALTAAKQLGVDSVLEGSFQREGDRLRVSVNLLRTSDGASLWSDGFDIRMADIFSVQDTVAQQVASRLRLQMDAPQRAQLTKHYTSNPVAYEFYLKGAYNFDQRMRDSRSMLNGTISYYRQAIEADPNFALAHAQLAYAYAVLAVFLEPTQPAWVERAKEEINRAQALDPQLAETHLARFQLLYSEFEGYQGEAATREVLLANQLNPNVGRTELAYMYIHLGLEDLAARELARALEVDPTSDALKETKRLMYEVQSRYDAYAADRSVSHGGRYEVWYWMGKGRLDEARKAMDDWSSKEPDHFSVRPTRALLLAAQGDFSGSEAEIPIILGKHRLKDPLYHHDAYDIACICALEGKSAEAVKWLRESAAFGYHLYPRYTRDAFLDRIRQSPEFIQFLAEMKAENERYRREFS
jgi:eukaryotic-like serine/threonine-protein kinase